MSYHPIHFGCLTRGDDGGEFDDPVMAFIADMGAPAASDRDLTPDEVLGILADLSEDEVA